MSMLVASMVDTPLIDDAKNWIPNIIMGKDYDSQYSDSPIHYDRLDNMAQFFGHDMPVHRHAQFVQIHYISSGAIKFHMDDEIYQMQGPGCFYTPASVPHSFFTEDNTHGHVLTIHQSMIWALQKDGLQHAENLDLNIGVGLDPSLFDIEKRGQWDLIGQLLNNIQLEWNNNHSGKEIMLENFVRLLIIQIARLSTSKASSTAANSEGLRLFRLFSDLVEEHYTQHWHLPQYTQVMNISESRLNHVCQQISNSSPKKLINDRLLMEVKRLLIFSTLSGKEICYQLGFEDPAYFSRFFKRYTGITLGQYRKRHS